MYHAPRKSSAELFITAFNKQCRSLHGSSHSMRDGHTARLPSWYAFGGVVSFLVLVCLVSIKLDTSTSSSASTSWKDGTANSHLPVMSSIPHEPWERDTADEYILRLQNVSSRSQIPQIRYHKFVVSTRSTYIGGVHRKITVINGKYPGPLIEAVEGDTLIIEVTNSIEYEGVGPRPATSIHFHGHLMNGTNFYDGSVGFTQCGIFPGKSFSYVFKADQPGTFWYHSHWDLQQVEGLVGPMVVHERAGLTAISRQSESQEVQEAILLLTDLYNRPAQDLLLDYTEPWIGGTEEPVPDVVLAQGKMEPTVIYTKGLKSRLRIINACSYTAFRVALEEFPMTAVEADSMLIEPKEVNSLMIFPSQRYSVDIELNETTKSAWLHTTPQVSLYGEDYTLSQSLIRTSGDLKTLIRADEHTEKLPLAVRGIQIAERDLVEPYFEPLTQNRLDDPVPTYAEYEWYIDISMTRLRSGEIAGALNNQVYHEVPLRNTLQSILATDLRHDESHRHDENRKHRHPKTEDKNQPLLTFHDITPIDLIFRNYDDGPHPLHLHGHQIWIMSRGNLRDTGSTWTPLYPLKRDTVWLPESQWVRVRMVVDNPGVWALHCHIPWHSRTGMKGAILALPSSLSQQKPPTDWYELCHA